MSYIYIEDVKQKGDKPSVRLVGTDGNVFSLLGECKKAMKSFEKENNDNKYNSNEQFNLMFEEINNGDYDNALQVMMKYCNVS